MQTNYPSPCLKCGKDCSNGFKYKKCNKWRTWFLWWWKHFRSVFVQTPALKQADPNKFIYAHPDETERYLRTSPCESCYAAQTCDVPCKAYLGWYNTRMEIVRKKVNYELQRISAHKGSGCSNKRI